MVPKAILPCENSISRVRRNTGKDSTRALIAMELDLNRVRNNVRKATTEDLLDRATVYRSEMEPAALRIIDAELIERGITVEHVEAHLEARTNALVSEEGLALKCS